MSGPLPISTSPATEMEALVNRTTASKEDRLSEAHTIPISAGERAERQLIVEIKGYRLVRPLASGGMGTVYIAEQLNPFRTVALKVIKAGMTVPEVMRRFEHEANLLARLQHPGIAQVYEAGVFDAGNGPQPFFAMEFIRGRTLTGYAEEEKLGLPERLALFAKVCDAVEHAHQKGIIHRDLKPDNILVDQSGQPKILDFGVAKPAGSLRREAGLSSHADEHAGQIIGTLGYMSPEQASGEIGEIDTRSDVYSLGVVCYRLLSGKMPYPVTGESLFEAVGIILEMAPAPLVCSGAKAPREVEAILFKALQKKKDARYQSAAELAAEIRRYLDGFPVLALPQSRFYLMRKFARRNKVLVIGVNSVALAMVVGIAATLWQARVAERQRDLARTEAATAKQVSDFLVNLFEVSDPGQGRGNEITAREILDVGARKVKEDLKDQPRIQATLLDTMGKVYMNLGLYKNAETLLTDAFDLRRALKTEDDPDTARSISRLAFLKEAEGNYDEAIAQHRKALDMLRRLLGPDHPDVADEMNLLAYVLQRKGNFDEAEALHRQALELRRKRLGDENPEVADSINHLAVLLSEKGDANEAEKLYRQSLEMERRLMGKNHPDVAITERNLALLLQNKGQHEEAEKLFRHALASERARHVGDHPDVAISLRNLAFLLQKKEEFEEANKTFAEELEMERRIYGGEHPEVARSLNNISLLLKDAGHYEQAEKTELESLSMRVKLLGSKHPDVASSLNNLAGAVKAQGRYDDAEKLYRRAIEIAETSLGPDHPWTKTFKDNLVKMREAMPGRKK